VFCTTARNPSSVTPSQSSSAPLHVSAALQALQVQEPEHVCVPDPPHEVEQPPVEPMTHAKPSSVEPSQSSSRPLHVSTGPPQAPQVQEAVQMRVPVPQEVEQACVEPTVHS
jgi:hypothetical protein